MIELRTRWFENLCNIPESLFLLISSCSAQSITACLYQNLVARQLSTTILYHYNKAKPTLDPLEEF